MQTTVHNPCLQQLTKHVNDGSRLMPTDAQKRPSVTLRASHKQPSASPLSYHRQGPPKWHPSKQPSSRLARLDKTHKAPQNLKQNATKVSGKTHNQLTSNHVAHTINYRQNTVY